MVLTCDKYFEIIRKNFFHEIIVLLYNIGAYTICFADWLYLGIMSSGYKIIQKRDKCISSKKAESTSPSFYFSGCGTTGMIFKMSWERRKKS